MCLKVIDVALDENRVGIGYKLMKRAYHKQTSMVLNGSVCSFEFGYKYRLNRWHKNEWKMRYTFPDAKQNYELGFHIFLTVEDARAYAPRSSDYVVCKVAYKDILAIGSNLTRLGNKKCVVAGQMKVLEIHP